MAIWCSICDKRGHATTDCWYKPNYIKEISREDGKLKRNMHCHHYKNQEKLP